MGQKVNPIGYRLAVRRNWESRWYATKQDFAKNVGEDHEIREYILNYSPKDDSGRKNQYSTLRSASIPRIFIERAGSRIRVKIFTAKPGVLIGKKGAGLEALKKDLAKFLGKDVMIDVQEIRKPELVAALVAENVALQLERRVSFRRALKKSMQTALQLGAEGVRLQISGRLGGTDIARREQVRTGRVPLQTIRENIDYGFAEAKTLWGTIGVKCWLCLKNEDRQLF